MFAKSFPEKIFVSNILSFFIKNDIISELLATLRELDSRLAHSKKYLEYSCHYLEKEGLIHELSIFQVNTL